MIDLLTVPGWEGRQGPRPGEYGDPHVYARDVHSGAGNCVCGRYPGHQLHVPVPAAPLGGYPLQADPDAPPRLECNLTDNARTALDQLVELDVPREVDAVNRAIIITAWIAEKRSRGYTLAMIDPDGDVRPVQGSDASGNVW